MSTCKVQSPDLAATICIYTWYIKTFPVTEIHENACIYCSESEDEDEPMDTSPPPGLDTISPPTSTGRREKGTGRGRGRGWGRGGQWGGGEGVGGEEGEEGEGKQ